MDKIFTLQKRAALAKAIRDADTIGIIASTRQNFDTIGAALGLYLALDSTKKPVQIVSEQEPLVEISNLFGINKISKNFSSDLTELTISFPYKEGEIEKVLYNTENDILKINFFAKRGKTITFSEDKVRYEKKGGSPSLIFAVAVSDDEIKQFVSDTNNVQIVRISRHPNDTNGNIVYTDKSFSSVAEIVTKIVQEQGFQIDRDAAQNLLDGVVYSTRNFTHPRTSAFSFDAAGFLLKKGAERRSKSDIEAESAEEQEINKQEKPQREEQRPDAAPQQNPQELKLENNNIPQSQEEQSQQQQTQSQEDQQAPQQQDDQVPSDWFEPKVFRSSGNKN